jgi:hypothetical protein
MQAFQRHANGHSEVLLVENLPELVCERIRHLLGQHLEADGERVARAHRPCEKIERIGKLGFKFPHPLVAIPRNDQKWNRPEQQSEGGAAKGRLQQDAYFHSGDSAGHGSADHGQKQLRHGPGHTGLFDHARPFAGKRQTGNQIDCRPRFGGSKNRHRLLYRSGFARNRSNGGRDLFLPDVFQKLHGQGDRAK